MTITPTCCLNSIQLLSSLVSIVCQNMAFVKTFVTVIVVSAFSLWCNGSHWRLFVVSFLQIQSSKKVAVHLYTALLESRDQLPSVLLTWWSICAGSYRGHLISWNPGGRAWHRISASWDSCWHLRSNLILTLHHVESPWIIRKKWNIKGVHLQLKNRMLWQSHPNQSTALTKAALLSKANQIIEELLTFVTVLGAHWTPGKED